ncbi:restriction endonuclease [bacterium (Candidatus Gribaldobacteria) CG08_land_8_20_14_0_20_39_15]|uniref:Methyltransferase n=1 Tax=bacterium (Candidatus Gribaldobacteria) CG08_land_8_20_14_0_20_39_15 TaxID=2014273 RepID=A0A2M6XTS9_9BACT|nr:MAG: restriction endonuclease [bacterium (Candidatus Gribaldobacteria) CG08_land_8_20_14_0_20_39_15]
MEIKDFQNQIIQGDILKTIAKIPDDSVDLTFADPPFNLKKKYSAYNDTKEVEEYLEWCYQWLSEMVRVTKPSGSILVHNIPKWLVYYGSHLNKIANFRHWISWEAVGAPLGKTLLPTHYGILFYTKQPKGFKFFNVRAPHKICRGCGIPLKDYGGKKAQMHPFGTILSDVWTDIHRIRHKKRRDEHPCQLPEHLLERLILITTDESDLVLDPFIGTGTTAVAAKRLGRNFIGIDIDKNYVEIAQQKIKEVEPTKINGCYVSIFLNKIFTIQDKDYQLLKDYLNKSEIKGLELFISQNSFLPPLFEIKKF